MERRSRTRVPGRVAIFLGTDFRKAYLPGVTNLTGAGQSVGLLQFDGYYYSDITNYAHAAGITVPNIVIVPIEGGVTNVNENGANSEVSIDIEMAMCMAPSATIYVYENWEGSAAGWDAIFSAMVTNTACKQFSCSYSGVSNPTAENLFIQMAIQGQSFFDASGDEDSFLTSGDVNWPGFPTDSPHITVVGGTTLTTASGSYSSESVWNWGYTNTDRPGYAGSSGGYGTDTPMPSYQAGISNAANLASTTCRNVPDVAMPADNIWIYFGNGRQGGFGGTSCAAPLWAGFMANVNQEAATLGKAPAGFINPAIYALGKGTNYNACFHDITTGTNEWPNNPNNFVAVTGYDLATGWGSPTGTNLINALVNPPVAPFLYETNQGSVAIIRFGGPGGAVSLPATLGSLPITSIGDFAFYEWAGLTSMSIPGSITNIGVGAFADCPGLTSVTVSNGASLWINNDAFADCSNLTAVYFTGNAPMANATAFTNDNNATVYYLPGTTGWGATFGGRPAVELIVANVNDSGVGSLRRMVSVTPSGWTLPFAAGLSGQTIGLTSGVVPITNNVTIDASMLPNGIQINGNHLTSIFSIPGGANVLLNSLTLTNGYAGGGASGGAIVNSGTLALNRCTLTGNSASGVGGAIDNVGPLTLTACTLANNLGSFAGAIQNDGPCTLVNCTFTGNYATNNGGAIDSDFSAVLTLTQCTFFGNTAGGAGGAVDNYLSTLNVANSILAGDNGGGDIYSWASSTVNINGENIVPVLDSLGTNGGTGTVITSAPMLAPLGNYGGPTETMPPLPGSPAIDAGSDAIAAGIATDQRGFPRVVGPSVDIGAVEYETGPLVSNNADNGLGSLRYVITYTTNGTTVSFAPWLGGSTVLLTSGPLAVNHSTTIDASALTGGLTINGNGAGRVLDVNSGTVVLTSLTITNGNDPSGGGGGIENGSVLTLNQCTLAGNTAGDPDGNLSEGGGAIYNESALTLNQCTLTGNSATQLYSGGGAILNFGSLGLNECTISSNSAGYWGGGIASYTTGEVGVNECTIANNSADLGAGILNYAGLLVLDQCTVAGNSALADGGGIFNYVTGTEADLYNSIVADNSASAGADIYNEGNLEYFGPNVIQAVANTGAAIGTRPINADPQLGPLGNYGGPTQTMPPFAGSPAIDAGDSPDFTTDQRGYPRISGLRVDIGAVEAQIASQPPELDNATFAGVSGSATFDFGFTNLIGGSFTVFATTNMALPFGDWMDIGPALEVPPGSGQFQFEDPQATNYPERFYQVTSP